MNDAYVQVLNDEQFRALLNCDWREVAWHPCLLVMWIELHPAYNPAVWIVPYERQTLPT